MAFGEFFDTERFREIGEFYWNEIERIDEPDVKSRRARVEAKMPCIKFHF